MSITCTSIKSGLHTANLSRQTRVGKPKLVCVNGTKTGGKHVCKLLASNSNVFTDCSKFYAVHTHQLEFANTSLPTLVCRVKAALRTYLTLSLNLIMHCWFRRRTKPSVAFDRIHVLICGISL